MLPETKQTVLLHHISKRCRHDELFCDLKNGASNLPRRGQQLTSSKVRWPGRARSRAPLHSKLLGSTIPSTAETLSSASKGVSTGGKRMDYLRNY
jgi:hypothetical protein